MKRFAAKCAICGSPVGEDYHAKLSGETGSLVRFEHEECMVERNKVDSSNPQQLFGLTARLYAAYNSGKRGMDDGV